MPGPLAPARLAFAPDGTPVSREYGDVYHSAGGGLAQARHVFLEGNRLPARWQGRRHFTILETGFGLGLNFLATWRAWRRDAQRCGRLHFVSIEKHPFTASDLESLLEKFPELNGEAAALLASWPMLVPGAHRLEFDRGNVVLTLFFSDVRVVRELALAADAFFLDGFSPAKNPDMWSPAVMRALSRLAAPDATAATWSVAAGVRSALESTGFAVEKRPGFGGKREMLTARTLKGIERSKTEKRSAIVIGAGIAGAAVSERLCARGWQVTLIERHATPAAEASGNHAGTFHPVVSPDDSVLARLTRAAFLYSLSRWQELEALQWQRCGVLQLSRDAHEEHSQRRSIEALALPSGFAQFLETKNASNVAGVTLNSGGLWFPGAGWIRPRSLVSELLLHCGTKLEQKFNEEVAHLKHANGQWICFDKNDNKIASDPVVVLANAADALRLAPQRAMRLRRVRGQLTLIPPIVGLRAVVLRGAMALPGVDGASVVGASYDIDDEDPEPRAESDAGNLARLEQILPGAAAGLDPAKLEGRVSFRAVVPDRLPVIGPIADPRGAGLYGAFAYGSRGLLWAGLGGELLASMIEGEPLPVERKLAAALDPGRFALRAARRRGQAS